MALLRKGERGRGLKKESVERKRGQTGRARDWERSVKRWWDDRKEWNWGEGREINVNVGANVGSVRNINQAAVQHLHSTTNEVYGVTR